MQSDSHALGAWSKYPTGRYPCQQLSPVGVEVRMGMGGVGRGQGNGEQIRLRRG